MMNKGNLFFKVPLENIEKVISQKETVTEQEENMEQRASFAIIKKSDQITRPIEIFSKIGIKGDYLICKKNHKNLNGEARNTKKIIFKEIVEKFRKNKNMCSEDDEFSLKSQKQDRNVTSNLIHHLLKNLVSNKETRENVEKISLERNFKISYSEFMGELEDALENLKTYVTTKHIKQLWFNAEKKEFCIIMRILSRKFFSKNGFLSIYHSNKFNKLSKEIHFKGARSLLEILKKREMERYHKNSR